MAQEPTKETLAPLTDETLVRPYDEVEIKWVNSAYHKAGTLERVHPLLAEKLVARSLAEYPKKGK